jgi:hypothetical protein
MWTLISFALQYSVRVPATVRKRVVLVYELLFDGRVCTSCLVMTSWTKSDFNDVFCDDVEIESLHLFANKCSTKLRFADLLFDNTERVPNWKMKG